MDYSTLIEEAKKRNNWTDYRLNKALGYKSISTIYAVKKGRKGLSADRLVKLMEFAGKTLAVALVISALLPHAENAQAAEKERTSGTLYIMSN
jgi:hypothetical protein